jgi:TPR repeat protein
MRVNCLLGVLGLVTVCPACGESPDMGAPPVAANAPGSALVDAPNGVCRSGAQLVPRVGCVDEDLAFPADAVQTCRSEGETACSARCQAGEAPSCTALAIVHEFALETTANTTYAARLLDQACAMRDGAACNDLGVMHGKGLGFPVDVDKAETLYQVACDYGQIVGCENLTRSRAWGSTPPDSVARAAEVVENACLSASDARACESLGWMRERGSAVPRDEAAALVLFKRACDAGAVGACEQLGRALLQGAGGPQDDKAAARLFRRACDDARSDGCVDLATMYCMGRGVPRDPARSTALLQQTCNAGDPVACRAGSCSSSRL